MIGFPVASVVFVNELATSRPVSSTGSLAAEVEA